MRGTEDGRKRVKGGEGNGREREGRVEGEG